MDAGQNMNRRSFLRVAGPVVGGMLGAHALSGCRRTLTLMTTPAPDTPPAQPTATVRIDPSATPVPDHSSVVIVKTEDRAQGLERALSILEANEFQGKHMFVKPNFNSSHAPPGSTHNDVLTTAVGWISAHGADRVTVGDRSGMEDTRQVVRSKGITALADELGFELIVFDELEADGWMRIELEGSHWPSGFAIARPVHEADGIISLCCLKTHRFGGEFTLSLKNSVGMVASRIPGDNTAYMNQLHNSPDQRLMIAEVNASYQPDLVVIDAVDAFVDGGPEWGTLAHPGLILAGRDRVALDAVGVALLRLHGTTPGVQQGLIFEQEQIKRAIELGLGVDHPGKIDLVPDNQESATIARSLQELLLAG